MVVILDVETIDIAYNCICDIAWATVDRNKVRTVKNYIPMEHLARMATGCFSEPKMAATMAEVANGNAIIALWDVITEELRKDCEEAKHIYAYNATFDRNAIAKTNKALAGKDTAFFEKEEIFNKWRDLWAWASNTILYKKSFIDFCEEHQLKTPKGFYSTSAETTLKYLRRDIDYVEQHTARADVLDEFEIYLAIKREIKREFSEICLKDEEVNFKGKPFFTIRRLSDAMNTQEAIAPVNRKASGGEH